MSRNEITLQEMFSSVIGELREGGRWGTAHIYQSAVNAFSAFTKWQPMPMRKLSPTVLKRFENFLRQRNCSWNTVSTYIKTVRSVYHRAVDRKYIRYVPRLFEHVYTGTRADRKKALEASDISSLVRETERSLQGGTLPNTQQRTRIFFVLMFMLRGIPFVDLAYLHKRDLQGNVLSYRRRKTGRALTVSLTPEAMQMVRMVANRNPDSPICFPFCRARKVRKRHTGNTSRHSGDSTSGWQYSGSAWECSRHSAPMQPDTPGPQWLTIARYTPESYRKPWGTPPSR